MKKTKLNDLFSSSHGLKKMVGFTCFFIALWIIWENKINKKPGKLDPLVVPAGTEQETGLTRAETEKAKADNVFKYHIRQM